MSCRLGAVLPVAVHGVHSLASLQPAGLGSAVRYRLGQGSRNGARLARDRTHVGCHCRNGVTKGGYSSCRALLIVADKGRSLLWPVASAGQIC